MYNPEIKEAFMSYMIDNSSIKDEEMDKRNIVNFFKRISPLEEFLKKDVLFLNSDEVEGFLQKCFPSGKDRKRNMLEMLQKYHEWGVSIKLIPENKFSNIRLEDIDTSSLEYTMLKSEDELIGFLDQILLPLSEDSSDNLKRCILLLVFSGIEYDDIWYIKNLDIDMENQTISYHSREVHLSDNTFKVLEYYLSMEAFIASSARQTSYKKDILREGFLISNAKSYGDDRDRMKKSYSSVFSRLMSLLPKKITPTAIRDSGVFYRIYLNEKVTGEIDFSEYLFFRRNNITTINSPDKIKEKCQHEYMAWKKAFYPEK